MAEREILIGGEESGCAEETTNVLIECAYFDPVRTAETGRKAGIISDARYRFERGVDPAFVEPGLDLATDMVDRHPTTASATATKES